MPLEALHYQLVCTANHVDIVRAVELGDHVRAKEIASAARRHAPASLVLRIAPKQVAHGPVVRHLLLPVDAANLVEVLDGRRQPAVHAEYFAVDDRRKAEVVEDLRAVPPHGRRSVLAQALIVKAVDLCDLARLMVAPDQRDSVRIAHLQRQQQQKRLHTIVAAVHEIAHKQVVLLGHIAANLEQLLQVVELTVDVAAHGHWRVHTLHVALLHQDLAGFGAQGLHLVLLDDLAALQLLDLSVQVAVVGHLHPEDGGSRGDGEAVNRTAGVDRAGTALLVVHQTGAGGFQVATRLHKRNTINFWSLE